MRHKDHPSKIRLNFMSNRKQSTLRMRPASSSVQNLKAITASKAFHDRGGSVDNNANKNLKLIFASQGSSCRSPFSKEKDNQNFIKLRKDVRKSSKDSK